MSKSAKPAIRSTACLIPFEAGALALGGGDPIITALVPRKQRAVCSGRHQSTKKPGLGSESNPKKTLCTLFDESRLKDLGCFGFGARCKTPSVSLSPSVIEVKRTEPATTAPMQMRSTRPLVVCGSARNSPHAATQASGITKKRRVMQMTPNVGTWWVRNYFQEAPKKQKQNKKILK